MWEKKTVFESTLCRIVIRRTRVDSKRNQPITVYIKSVNGWWMRSFADIHRAIDFARDVLMAKKETDAVGLIKLSVFKNRYPTTLSLFTKGTLWDSLQDGAKRNKSAKFKKSSPK